MKRLRVSIPDDIAALPETVGHGRVWRRILAELDGLVALERRSIDGGDPRRGGVWLIDGHEYALRSALPVVAQVHEAPWGVPELRGQLSPAFAELSERRTIAGVRSAQRLITGAEATRKQLADVYGYDPDRIHPVFHGVDSSTFSPRDAARGRARIGSPYVLFAATLQPRKNLPALREAMAMLAAAGFPHALALVVAGAPDRADLPELAAQALAELPGAPGRIVRVERPDDAELAALMAGADAFCLPSLWEGFGLTALEALACGTVVVVSDRGALPEVVGDAGVAAEPTADGLVTALRGVLGDPARAAELRRAARQRALALSWRAAARGGWRCCGWQPRRARARHRCAPARAAHDRRPNDRARRLPGVPGVQERGLSPFLQGWCGAPSATACTRASTPIPRTCSATAISPAGRASSAST